MAVDFPASPTDGQIFAPAPGRAFVYRSALGAWRRPPRTNTALPKNYLMNPSMQIVEQYPFATYLPNSTGATSGSFYPADQWMVSWGTGGNYLCSVQTGSSFSGSYGVMQINGSSAAMPAAGYLQMQQAIEGQKANDFMWGSATGKYAVFAFGFWASMPGTFSVQIKNADASYTFLAPFTVPSATWTRQTISVPPPPNGSVWKNDTTLGINVGLGLDAGTTYGGGSSGWQNANKVCMTGNTSLSGSGATALISDLGFYLDPYQTGVAPPWDYPDYIQELRRVRRYWIKMHRMNGIVYNAGGAEMNAPTMQYMVSNTAGTATNGVTVVSTPMLFDGSVTATVSAIPASGNWSNFAVAYFDVNTTTSPMTVGRPAVMYIQDDTKYMAISCRLM